MAKIQQERKLYDIHYITIFGSSCVYCGDYAEVYDHLLPISKYSSDAKKELMVKVPACFECNALANDYSPKSFEDKKQYIHNKIRHKYNNLLNTPNWEPNELKKLKGKLKKHITKSIELKNHILRRLEFNG